MVAGLGTCLLPLRGDGDPQFFRLVAPAASAITSLDPDGTISWACDAVGLTGRIQRATSLAAGGNWVDFVQVEISDATMSHRLFDPTPLEGMVLIPGGTNSGTNPIDDEGYHSNNYPATYSTSVSSFYMDRHLVTKGLWDEVRNHSSTVARGYEMRVGGGQGANHPVHTVNWYDAVKWLNARSELAGREPVYHLDAAHTQVFRSGGDYMKVEPYVKASANGYRLPSMDQWEYAARGGLSSRRFPWGDTINHDHANYCASHTDSYDTNNYTTWTHHPQGTKTGSKPYTTPVGYFPPNGYGLHDMAGNLMQWNYDWHPLSVGYNRVLRGGSWRDAPRFCRAGHFVGVGPDGAGSHVGFRAVLLPDR